jgi:hypothetical protein
MHISDISIIGWFHTFACIAALVLGAMNLVAGKGAPPHKRRRVGPIGSSAFTSTLRSSVSTTETAANFRDLATRAGTAAAAHPAARARVAFADSPTSAVRRR